MPSIVTVTEAATSFLLASVDDLKAEIALETDDNTITLRCIKTASAQVTRYLNRVLARETVSETFRFDGAGWNGQHRDMSHRASHLVLDRYPVAQIISVTVDGTTLDPTTDYECDMESGQLFRLWGDRRASWSGVKIVVVYQAGYVLPPAQGANLPDEINTATIRLAAQLFQAREREQGLKSEIVPGVIERQYWDMTASGEQAGAISPDLQALLDPYRRVTFK